MGLKVYRCVNCKKTVISKEELTLGGDWKEIVAGETEGAKEKHIPVVVSSDGAVVVNVGSVSHPMTAEHLIEWVAVETTKGYAVHYFTATDKPEANFALAQGDELKAVYAYCNLHGLWKA